MMSRWLRLLPLLYTVFVSNMNSIGWWQWQCYWTGSTGESEKQQPNKGIRQDFCQTSSNVLVGIRCAHYNSWRGYSPIQSHPMTGGEFQYTGLVRHMGNITKGTLVLLHSAQLDSLPLISALVRHRIQSSTCLQNQNMNRNARENLALAAIPG